MTDTDISTMTLEQTRAAAQELLDNTTGDLTGTDAQRFESLSARANQLREQERQRDVARRDLVQGLASGQFRTEGEGHGLPGHGRPDAGNEDRTPALAQRDTAMRTLDRVVKTEQLAARGAELVENLMSTGPALAQNWTQRWATATGSEHYERAFAKKLADPDNGHLTWTPQEADAWRAVTAVQAEQRAMSLTDSAGGFMVPLTIDPAVQLTSAGSINPLRQLARVVQTATDAWSGITSAGVTAEWTAEAAEVADASPTLANPSIPVHKGDAFVPFSFEIEGDAVNFLGELSKLLVDGAEQLNATAYTTGSGTGQPKGVITSLVGAAGTVPLVAPGTAETLAASDVYSVQNALPPRFQPNAQWCANLAIINNLRQFETGNGSLKFPSLQDNPPRLLGRGMNELSNMDGTINAAATENNYPLLYGDFAAGMVIVDRIGSTLELVQHLFGANRRPTGQRGALLWFRTGSDVIIPNAFRLLSIPTTA
ncbi:phage major capsid protein [Mycolicibacterium fortuitum]|uniref:phage major capsid protein n=1 Tax=Mycolicibacterium fortuitum TaxID=1766 RepID=UPI001130F473|nr:phage major capsid protein [Mycolicibacterium fortuitum]TPW98033.1 phage major capsid protein [Mycolicibacterium fortuitum]